MPWKSMTADHRELEKELLENWIKESFISSTTYSERGKSIVLITLKGPKGLIGYEGKNSI